MAAAGVAARFWSSAAAQAGRMPGTTRTKSAPRAPAQGRRLVRRADHPVEAAALGQPRQALGLGGGAARDPGGPQVAVVEGGEHGDANHKRARLARLRRRFGRGLHHRRAARRMDGQHERPERKHGADRRRKRVRNVVELEVEEHQAVLGDAGDARRAVRREERLAQLDPAAGAGEALRQRRGALGVRRIQGDEDAV